MSMEITFLGTSSAAPTRYRNVSGSVVSLDGNLILVDCGEGTQHQVKKASLKWARLTRIFITHCHGDHIFGLPGLMCSMGGALPEGCVMEIYGPPGLRAYIRTSLKFSASDLGYTYRVVELHPPTIVVPGMQPSTRQQPSSFGHTMAGATLPGARSAYNCTRSRPNTPVGAMGAPKRAPKVDGQEEEEEEDMVVKPVQGAENVTPYASSTLAPKTYGTPKGGCYNCDYGHWREPTGPWGMENILPEEDGTWKVCRVEGDKIGYTVTARAIDHRVSSLAFSFEEDEKKGALDAGALRSLGVSPGPLYAELKTTGRLVAPEGSVPWNNWKEEGGEGEPPVILLSQVCGAASKGRKMVLLGDTSNGNNALVLAKDADVVIHESTHQSSLGVMCRKYGHSTPTHAAQFMKDSGAKRLILTHFSSRYRSRAALGTEKVRFTPGSGSPHPNLDAPPKDLEEMAVEGSGEESDPEVAAAIDGEEGAEVKADGAPEVFVEDLVAEAHQILGGHRDNVVAAFDFLVYTLPSQSRGKKAKNKKAKKEQNVKKKAKKA